MQWTIPPEIDEEYHNMTRALEWASADALATLHREYIAERHSIEMRHVANLSAIISNREVACVRSVIQGLLDVRAAQLERGVE